MEAQKEIRVYYKGREVGLYYADLVVDDLILLELKAGETIMDAHEAQIIDYLRGTDKEVGVQFWTETGIFKKNIH